MTRVIKAAPRGLATRQRLPDRRRQRTIDFEWKGRQWTVSVGFYGNDNDPWEPGEVFAQGAKIGSEIAAVIEDANIMASVLLQMGVTKDELFKLLSREGTDISAPAASIVGLIVEKMREVCE